MTSKNMKLNPWFVAAAILSFATTGLHVIGGTPEIMDPIYASNAPQLSIGISEVMWNQITLLLALVGVAFGWAALKPQRAVDLVVAVIALYVGIALLFIYSGLQMFQSLWVMPQWSLFLAMAALALVGLWRRRPLAQ